MLKSLKLILALLLLLCLVNMPYGYYQLVRWMAMVVFILMAMDANQRSQETEMIICVGLAILFQPVFKIALGRELWNIVDVVVGIGLFISVFDVQKQK